MCMITYENYNEMTRENGEMCNLNDAAFLNPDVTTDCDSRACSGTRLGVDIGGTNIKFAVVEKNEIKYKTSIPTADTCEKIISDICDEMMDIFKQYHIEKVGVGTPGIIKAGLVSSANLAFEETPLAKLISEKIGVEVSVENDANCAALGEITFGGTNDRRSIVLVTLGTGIGGGVIIDGKLCQSNNNAGEVGHMIIQTENGKKCPCGQSGCWEQYCSMTALIESAKEYALANKDSVLYNMYIENGNKLDGKLIFDALEKGCSGAEKVFGNFLDYLACGIESLFNILGPDEIVLAGAVTAQGEKLLAPLKKRLKKDIHVEISALQGDAGSLGAAML